MTIQIDNKNHEGISLREKINHLLKPSVAIKLVLVQKHELERIQLNNNGLKLIVIFMLNNYINIILLIINQKLIKIKLSFLLRQQ